MSLRLPLRRDKIGADSVHGLRKTQARAVSIDVELTKNTAALASILYLELADVATTGNISLTGIQNLDGESGAEGDIVLVRAQTDATENGLYTMRSGTWDRVTGAVTLRHAVRVRAGTVMGETTSLLLGEDDPVIGTDDIEYQVILSGSGTANSLARWTGGGLGDSLVQDSGTHITIGTGAGPTGLVTIRRDLAAASALYVHNESTSGSGQAIYGFGRNATGAAIEGYSLGTQGKGVYGRGYYGVHGTTGTGDAGVYAEATGAGKALSVFRNVASGVSTISVAKIEQKDTGNAGVALEVVQAGSSDGLAVTGGSGRALYIVRNNATATTPVAYIHQDHATNGQPVLRINGDGTGDIVQAQVAGATVFSIEDDGVVNMDGCGVIRATRTVSANTTITKDDYLILCDTSAAAGNFTVTLPTPRAGMEFVMINLDGTTSNTLVTLARSGTESIDGVAGNTTYGSSYWKRIIWSDGTNWFTK